jgi:hypothetical protein
MLFNGKLRVKLDGVEAAARDRAFVRFMEAVTAGLEIDERSSSRGGDRDEGDAEDDEAED